MSEQWDDDDKEPTLYRDPTPLGVIIFIIIIILAIAVWLASL